MLEGPFRFASRVARKVFWFLPGVSLLVHGQLDTQAWLKEIRAPVLIVHCSQDPVIPFHLGQEVYVAALPPKDFLQINGYCHEEPCLIAPTQYRTALQEFLTRVWEAGVSAPQRSDVHWGTVLQLFSASPVRGYRH